MILIRAGRVGRVGFVVCLDKTWRTAAQSGQKQMPHSRGRAFVLHIPNDLLRHFAVLEPFMKRLGHDRADLEEEEDAHCMYIADQNMFCIVLQDTRHRAST